MWRILLKTVPVNLKKDIATYLLMGALIAAGMYIASAFAGITYSCSDGFERNSIVSNSEDGQFQVMSPLDEQKETKIRQKGYTLERAFYYDAELEDGSVIRVMRTRQTIDKIVLDEGTLAQTDTDAVVDKCYAYHHGLKVSDTIKVAGADLHICGVGSVTDYDSPSAGMNDFSSDSKIFGLIFVTDECYRALLADLGSDTRENYIYAYKLSEGITDEDLRKYLVNELDLLSDMVTFVPEANNGRIGASLDDNASYGVVGMFTGVGLMILVSMVFFLRIQFSLDKQSPSIGALLAMGVNKRDIYPMLLLPFALVALCGGLVGFGLSRIFTMEDLMGSEGYYCTPDFPVITHPFILAYCVFVPPLVCTVINLLLMRKNMSQSVVSLLLSGSKSKDGNRGIVAAMIVGSLLSATILMTGRGVGLYCTTIKDRLPEEIRYSYVYEMSEEQTEVPAGAQGAYRHVFSVEDHDYIRDIQFVGIEDGNPYFDAKVADLDGGIVISSSVSSRYGLDEGDKFDVFDSVTGKEYSFDIKGVTDYSVLLTVFMNIDDLRSLLGVGKTVYNMVYSDTPIDYSNDILFGSLSKEEVIAPVETLEPEVQSSRDSFYALAILFYAVIMIYLFQFAVVRRRRDIACLSSFGYRNGEQIRFLTGKLTILACVGAAICLLVGYWISLQLMPDLVASVPIGLMIDYHLPEYIVHLAVALVIIFISVLIGMRQVANNDSLYYLRSRE